MSQQSQERRKFKRYKYTTMVEVRYENQSEVHTGTMQDYSSKGMCITSDSKINMDKNVYIRMKEYHPGRKGVNSYEWYSAHIMWGRPAGEAAGAFIMGVQFPQPLLY